MISTYTLSNEMGLKVFSFRILLEPIWFTTHIIIIIKIELFLYRFLSVTKH